MLEHLENMFIEVRKYLLTTGYNETRVLGVTYRDGDISRGFDRESER